MAKTSHQKKLDRTKRKRKLQKVRQNAQVKKRKGPARSLDFGKMVTEAKRKQKLESSEIEKIETPEEVTINE